MQLFIGANSPTFDEPQHLCGGLNYLKNHDFSSAPELGVFPQALSALFNLDKVFPSAEFAARHANSDHTISGIRAHPHFRLHDDPLAYAKGRWAIAFLSVMSSLALFWTARLLAGRLPAVLALALYCFNPSIVANGALATSDMAATFGFLISCLALWRLFRTVSFPRFAIASSALSILFLSKMSAPLIVVYALVMALMRALSKPSLHLALPFMPDRHVKGRLAKLSICLAALVATGLAVCLAIWIAYGFQSSISPEGVDSGMTPVESLLDGGAVSRCAKAALDAKLLPEAFVYGFVHNYVHAQVRWSFLNGKSSMTGFWSFFPLAFLIKTPPAALASMIIGLALAPLLWLRGGTLGRARLFHLLPVLLFSIFYFAVAACGNLNIGFRHLLPVIPGLILLCALGFRQLLRFRYGWLGGAALALCCALEAFMASPSQLAYISPLFGGRDNGWRLLADSSLDWGQDLRNLNGALEKNDIMTDGQENVYLAYFGSIPASDSNVVAKIVSVVIGHQFERGLYEFKGGVYCVSATVLQGVNSSFMFPDIEKDKGLLRELNARYYELLELQKDFDSERLPYLINGDILCCPLLQYDLLRFERIRRALVKRKPMFTVGGSILVFRLSDEELKGILGPEFAPPAPKAKQAPSAR